MSDHDFSLACEAIAGFGDPWLHVRVVHLRGREAISELFRYEITLLAKGLATEIDPRDLVGKRASLRIATLSIPAYKVVHGIVEQAEDLYDVPEGSLLRIVLVPPWTRATHRQRCRVFLDKTLRHIVNAVLEGDPLVQHTSDEVEPDDGAPFFAPAKERFTWRIKDASRIDNVRARPFVVQYNESDFAFVSRLLEEEGISFHFEHGGDTCLLVLTDHDGGRARCVPDAPLGAAIPGRQVDSVRLGARLRPTKVVLADYDWRKPNLDMTADAGDAAADLAEYHYPGSYFDAPAQGKPVAAARADRYAIEAKYAVAKGSVRLLGAGCAFQLLHDQHDGEYLVTSLEVRGEQQGVISQASGGEFVPWTAGFELARRGAGSAIEDSRFRPARSTPKPRIRGVQTAVVTADPGASGAEVNVGGPDGISIGCVRVRFRWDTDATRLASEPSSTWVRVSQIFAGAGEGAVFHPRIGDEVLVDFDEGDPDRPIVVGRVYNGANLPMHAGAPKSSMKSLSTPGGGTYNEIMFDDSAGGELLHYFAGKNQTTDVANMRRESVVTNAKMTVGANNTETIGASRTESVGANDTLCIGVNQNILIGANSTTIIGGNFEHTVGANEANTVGVSQLNIVGGNVIEKVGGPVLEIYGSSRTTTVGAAVTEDFGAAMAVLVGGNVVETCASHSVKVGAARLIGIFGDEKTTVGGSNTTKVGAVVIDASAGSQKLDVTGGITRNAPVHLVAVAFDGEFEDSYSISSDALSVSVTGLSVGIFDLKASVTGLSLSMTGIALAACGADGGLSACKIELAGIALCSSGLDHHAGGPDAEV